MDIEMLPLDAIRPYWRNPRRNEDAVEAVALSITRYGMNQPLVVDADHVIIVGDTRYRALRMLGEREAPVVVRDLPAEQAREYRIADNKTHELAGWDEARLIAELRAIGAEPMRAFYTDPHAVDRMLGELRGVPAASVSDVAMPTLRDDQLRLTCPTCGFEFREKRELILSRAVPATRVATAIMAVRERQEMAEALSALLGGVPISYDEERRGPAAGWLAAAEMALTAATASHILVLQEDTLPCLDLIEGVRRVCVAHPERMVVYFASRSASKQIERARAAGERVAPIRSLYGLATSMPRAVAEAFLPWAHEQTGDRLDPKGRIGDDHLTQLYARENGGVLTTVPSLVEHGSPGVSTLGHNNRTWSRMAYWFIGADVSALTVWT